MKKSFITVGLGTLLLTTSLMAEEVKSASTKSDGFYLGAGGGVTFNLSMLSVGDYQDDTSTYRTSSLSDSDAGYIVYGGYQFNKIIAVEAAYTDYGSFSDSAVSKIGGEEVTFKSDPNSVAVYANAGYTFENGLRPFGQIGLGYLTVNGSNSTKNIGIDDSVSMRFGLGLEYAPVNFSGFGLRVAYIDELTMDGSYESDDNGKDTSTLMMNVYGMLYVGAQYKF